MSDKKFNLKESLAKLNDIVSWFEDQEEVDVETGLEKIKEGADLVKACKARLTEVRNEFEQIQKDVESEEKLNIEKARIATEEDSLNPEDIQF